MRSEQSFVIQWGTAFQVWNNTASPADLVTVSCMVLHGRAVFECRLSEQLQNMRAADLQNVNVEAS